MRKTSNYAFKKRLEERTLLFSVRLFELLDSLPNRRVFWIIQEQMGRSGASIGANYREANRAVSKADFSNKIGIATKESSETVYWLTVLSKLKFLPEECLPEVEFLLYEASELLAIFYSVHLKVKDDKK